jgi:hypothetical protein
MQGGKLIFIVLIVLLVAGLLATTSSLTRARADFNELERSTEAIVLARETEIRRNERSLADAEWEEREKYCNADGRGHSFVGPDDYGRFGFFHPCSWAIHVPSPALHGGNFEAVFHPRRIVNVPNAVYALRFTILTQQYDSVIQQRQGLVQSGRLTQSTFTNVLNQGRPNEQTITGMRFDGEMVHGVAGGSEVIFRIRDRTAIVRTDSGLFKDDFERLIRTIVYTP